MLLVFQKGCIEAQHCERGGLSSLLGEVVDGGNKATRRVTVLCLLFLGAPFRWRIESEDSIPLLVSFCQQERNCFPVTFKRQYLDCLCLSLRQRRRKEKKTMCVTRRCCCCFVATVVPACKALPYHSAVAEKHRNIPVVMFRSAFVRPASRMMVLQTGGQKQKVPSMLALSLTTRTYTRGTTPLLLRFTGNHGSSTIYSAPCQNLVRCSLKVHPMPLAVHLGSLSHFSSSSGKRPPLPPSGNKIARGIGIAGTTALVLFGKGKYILGALKLTKFASLGSMLLSVGTYSMVFGFPYAVGMVGLMLTHESGHVLAMRHYGIPFSPMVFIPFVGATVAMNKMPRDAWEDAMVALGGPVLGSAGAAVVAVGAQVTQSQLLFALADFGFMINLFNLLPVGILDGGRIASALSPYAGVAGLGLGGALAYTGTISNPIFYLVLLAGGWETFQRFYNSGVMPPNYYQITQGQRLAITGGYFGLIGALLVAMAINQQSQKPPEVLKREQQEKTFDMRD